MAGSELTLLISIIQIVDVNNALLISVMHYSYQQCMLGLWNNILVLCSGLDVSDAR